IDGILAGRRSSNLLAFAAAFRGLLGSAGDSQDSSGLVIPTLAAHIADIDASARGLASTFFAAPELENALIHFMYARRLKHGESAPLSHKTKNNADYLSLLQRGFGPDAAICYGDLCKLAH